MQQRSTAWSFAMARWPSPSVPEACAPLWHRSDSIKECDDCTWHNAWVCFTAQHGVGLAAACNPICQHCTAQSLRNLIHCRRRNLLKHLGSVAAETKQQTIESQWPLLALRALTTILVVDVHHLLIIGCSVKYDVKGIADAQLSTAWAPFTNAASTITGPHGFITTSTLFVTVMQNSKMRCVRTTTTSLCKFAVHDALILLCDVATPARFST